MQRRLLLDVVVGQRAPVLELLAGKDQTLLVRGNAFLVLDLGLDILNGVRALHLKGDGLARQCFDLKSNNESLRGGRGEKKRKTTRKRLHSVRAPAQR